MSFDQDGAVLKKCAGEVRLQIGRLGGQANVEGPHSSDLVLISLVFQKVQAGKSLPKQARILVADFDLPDSLALIWEICV